MRLDFNVLWVEDQPNAVHSQIEAITKQMADEGFDFKPKLCASIDQVRAEVIDEVFNDEVDLILVDWDLGTEEGQDAIEVIRDHIQYKDVVFYSALKPVEEIRELAFGKGLEGVFCTIRQELVEEVMGIFEGLVKKVLDLDHSRGIIMGATSDIDHLVRECLAAMYDQLDGEAREVMVGDALALIDAYLERLNEKVSKLKESRLLSEILGEYTVLTSHDRLRMLSRILKGNMFEAFAGYRSPVVKYMQEVVPQRNVLGHQVLSPEGKPVAVEDAAGRRIGLEEMRVLRRNLLDLRQAFRDLHKLVRGA